MASDAWHKSEQDRFRDERQACSVRGVCRDERVGPRGRAGRGGTCVGAPNAARTSLLVAGGVVARSLECSCAVEAARCGAMTVEAMTVEEPADEPGATAQDVAVNVEWIAAGGDSIPDEVDDVPADDVRALAGDPLRPDDRVVLGGPVGV